MIAAGALVGVCSVSFLRGRVCSLCQLENKGLVATELTLYADGQAEQAQSDRTEYQHINMEVAALRAVDGWRPGALLGSRPVAMQQDTIEEPCSPSSSTAAWQAESALFVAPRCQWAARIWR